MAPRAGVPVCIYAVCTCSHGRARFPVAEPQSPTRTHVKRFVFLSNG